MTEANRCRTPSTSISSPPQRTAPRADAEDALRGVRQNRRHPGFRSSIDLIGRDRKDSRAGLEHKQIEEFGIDGIPAPAGRCVYEDFRLRFSVRHLAR